MNKELSKILILLTKHQALNCQEIQNLLRPYRELDYIVELLKYLSNEHLITEATLSPSQGNRSSMVFLTSSFKITMQGRAYLDEEKRNNNRFRIQSIYIPITVAFITSLLTNVIAQLLLR